MVIRILNISVSGMSEAGAFEGSLSFLPGLQVVTGRNHYGKSLAVKVIPWCLGVEAIFGRQANDPWFLPMAVREVITFPGAPGTRVLAAEGTIVLEHDSGRRLQLSRYITHQQQEVRALETSATGETTTTKLLTGASSMLDEHAGLQNFLFKWLAWPRVHVLTFEGKPAPVYLENLLPLFYIEQEEGWTELQARQIGRYGQQQIRQAAFEYLLGATDAIDLRYHRQLAVFGASTLRANARGIAERVTALFLRHGWSVDWSGNGSVQEIETRWSARRLLEALHQDARIDLAKERARISERIELLRATLTTGPIDPSNVAAPALSGQRAIELKQRRTELNAELRTLRQQREEAEQLEESLSHRIKAANDVVRLKRSGVGRRIVHAECPTCHRKLDPETFDLAEQDEADIDAHVDSLKRDRQLMARTVQGFHEATAKSQAAMRVVDRELHEAQRELATVTAAVGPVREQLGRAAMSLAAEENALDRVKDVVTEIRELQALVDDWLKSARDLRQPPTEPKDLASRVDVFTKELGETLTALGHEAIVEAGGPSTLRLDDHYEPYLGHRRLRAMGSASDHPRLIGAYSLALAYASQRVAGLHPGVVVLDEPLQQNPDKDHRDLFSGLLSRIKDPADRIQTIIFTNLTAAEQERLNEAGTRLIVVEGPHFLRPVSTTVEEVDEPAMEPGPTDEFSDLDELLPFDDTEGAYFSGESEEDEDRSLVEEEFGPDKKDEDGD